MHERALETAHNAHAEALAALTEAQSALAAAQAAAQAEDYNEE